MDKTEGYWRARVDDLTNLVLEAEKERADSRTIADKLTRALQQADDRVRIDDGHFRTQQNMDTERTPHDTVREINTRALSEYRFFSLPKDDG